jgi:hypothetical protein
LNYVNSVVKKVSKAPIVESPSFFYGSKSWANFILKLGIAECNNINRVGFARLQEIFYYMRILSEAGFEWQSQRLRNHYHLAVQRGRFTVEQGETDSLEKREEASS